jgi:hypothetical protein
LHQLLNGDIDRLEQESKRVEVNSNSDHEVNALKQTMKVLKTRWPAKKPLIETELRKLVTEIGLDRIIR